MLNAGYVSCIDCYVCSSIAGSNIRCETLNQTGLVDPFYQEHCMAGRKVLEGR